MPVPGGDGERCEQPLRLFGTTTVAITSTTAGFADDEGTPRSSCGGGGAPDVVFTFNASTSALIDVLVISEAQGFQPIVKLRGAARGCLDLDDACDSAIQRGADAEVKDWAPAVAGIQYVIVDGAAQTSGPFTLKVTQR